MPLSRLACLTLVLTAGLSPAFAGQAAGTVKTVDLAANTVTLFDGRVFAFDPRVSLKVLKPGFRVEITYAANGSVNAATAFNVSALTTLPDGDC
jgi:hypothetical protein